MFRLDPHKLFTTQRPSPFLFAFAPMEPYTANPILREIMGQAGAELVFRPKILPQHLLKAKIWQKYEMIKEIQKLTTPTKMQVFDLIQIIARPDDPIKAAIQYIEQNADQLGIFGIDLNFSCPGYKVLPQRRGGELLKNPDIIFKVIEQVFKYTSLPVSVKIRRGYLMQDSPTQLCAQLKNYDLAWITVNRAPVKVGPQMGDFIRNDYTPFQQAYNTLEGKIPLIANGQLDPTLTNIGTLLFGCKGIMIGTAAMGNPTIFHPTQIKNTLKVQIRIDLENLFQIINKYQMGQSGRWCTIGPIKQLLFFYIKHHIEEQGRQMPPGTGFTKWTKTKYTTKEFCELLNYLIPEIGLAQWQKWIKN